MTDKPKTETANDTVEHQLETLSSTNAVLKKANDELTTERDLLKKQNAQLGSVIENQLKADLKVAISARSAYTDTDLASMTYDQLKQIHDTLSRIKGDTTSYKPIRTGSDAQSGRATVGDLYGKTRAEILKMGGDF